MEYARTTAAFLAACLTLTVAAAARAQDPGMELPPGIDLNLEPVPSSGNGQPGEWAPVPVIPPGTDTGMPLDLPPGTETQKTAEPVNPLDEVFGGALEAYRGRDYVTARDLWGELTDAGHELSTHNLAVLLWRGQGGPQDRQEAFDLFHAAEELKVAESAHALGVIHLRGLGVAKNPTIAMQHFEKGSEMGHGPSTYNLAVAHLKGIGVPADPDHGMELMTAAAEGGLTRAQYDLANLLVRGTYGTPNPAAARDWYPQRRLGHQAGYAGRQAIGGRSRLSTAAKRRYGGAASDHDRCRYRCRTAPGRHHELG